MLRIEVPLGVEKWDEETETFIEPDHLSLDLEHSLVSLSKWESKWHKPFLTKERKTVAETMDYIKCMTVTENVDPHVYDLFTTDNLAAVNDYIGDPMTATTVSEDRSGKPNRETVTAELIYYWMIALQIPFECQYWHLNKLLTLIKVCNIKNQPPKKMSKRDIMSRNAALNAARRKQLNSKG
jgi:hypothetical protein